MDFNQSLSCGTEAKLLKPFEQLMAKHILDMSVLEMENKRPSSDEA
ncbi:1627_t:CDS:2, partial [Scutellospora calospora]